MESYCITLQRLTKMQSTLSSNVVNAKVKLCKCLRKRRDVVSMGMKQLVEGYRIALQCFTKMSSAFYSNVVHAKIKQCKCLWRRRELVFDRAEAVGGRLLYSAAVLH